MIARAACGILTGSFGTEVCGLGKVVEPREVWFRCPGCGRVINASGLRPGERFKCAKCKLLMSFGPHLFRPRYAVWCQTLRLVVLFTCLAATVWCVTLGVAFGQRTKLWAASVGGAAMVWILVAACIGLAAKTTRNYFVVAGVTSIMAGVALYFIERLGHHVGYPVMEWRRYRNYHLWVPSLIVFGLLVLAAALVVQKRRRSL